MTKLHVSKEALQQIEQIFQKMAPDAIVWAYGSRITGDCHEGSDLDLVIKTFGHSEKSISKIRNAFSESNIPFLIDIRYWEDLPASFQEEIAKKYIVIYGAVKPKVI